MCISTANTHTTPLGVLHFPSLLCRVSGCINSSWAHKFREPPWKENSETKGRERHFQCCFVLLQEAQRQPFRQQKPQVTEWALPTRRSRSSLYMELWRDAGSIPSFGLLLLQPAPLRLKGTAARGQAPRCHRSCSNNSVFRAVCCHPPARVCG